MVRNQNVHDFFLETETRACMHWSKLRAIGVSCLTLSALIMSSYVLSRVPPSSPVVASLPPLEECFEIAGPSRSAVPSLINASNVDSYFKNNPGIFNCNDKSGSSSNPMIPITQCPAPPFAPFVREPGKIYWNNSESPVFQSRNPIFTRNNSGGFFGFRLSSVPTGDTYWNSIWLISPDVPSGGLEIDVYEMMHRRSWWLSPKLSIHDYSNDDLHKGPCFGLYLNGDVEGGTCTTNVITNATNSWDWTQVENRIYNGASWYTRVSNETGQVKVYIGLNLDGWLPFSAQEASIENVKNRSDFLIESPDGSIKASLEGGFWVSLASTAVSYLSPNNTAHWHVPCITAIDF